MDAVIVLFFMTDFAGLVMVTGGIWLIYKQNIFSSPRCRQRRQAMPSESSFSRKSSFPFLSTWPIFLLLCLSNMGYARQGEVIRPELPKRPIDVIHDPTKIPDMVRPKFEPPPLVPPVVKPQHGVRLEPPTFKGKIDLPVTNGRPLSKATLDVSPSQTLVAPYLETPPRISGQDLTRFYEVNQRILDDLGITPLGQLLHMIPAEAFKMRPQELRSLINAEAESTPLSPRVGAVPDWAADTGSKAVSIARLADGNEVFTVFDLQDPRRRGRSFTISAKDRTAIKALERELAGSRRVYRYGPTARHFDLGTFVHSLGAEEIRRTAYTSKYLPDLELSLNEVDRRSLNAESTILLNGLPSTKQSAAQLGLMSGDPEAWVEFYDNVDELLTGPARKSPVTQAEFNDHLVHGNSDIIVLVAHADGIRIFLNDKVVTLDDISSLPSRTTHSARPRVAVLVSCDAGAQMTTSSLFFRKDIPNFADVLLTKGFADVVIAPDHKIRKAEVLEVIRQLPKGLRTNDLPAGWNKITQKIPGEGGKDDNAVSS